MPLSVEMHSGHWTVDAADVLCIQVAMTSLWFTVDSWCSWCVVYAGCNDVLVVYCGLLMQLMCCVYRLQWRPCGLLWTVDADDVLSMQVAMTSLWFTVVSWCSWCVVYTGCNDVLVVYCGQLMQLMCCVYRLQWRPCCLLWTVDAADVLSMQVAMMSLWFTVDCWCSWCVVYAGCNDVLVVYCGQLMQLMCCVYRLQWHPCGLLWTVDAADVLSIQVAMMSLWFTVDCWCRWCVVYAGCNDVLVVYCGQLMQLMCCLYRLQWRPCGLLWTVDAADVLSIQVAMTSLWFTVDSWCSWCVVYTGCNDVLVVYCGQLMQLMCCLYRLQWRPCGLLWTIDAADVLSIQVAMTSLWFTVDSWCSWCVVYTGCNDVLVVLGGFGNQQMPVDTVEKFDPKTQEWQPLPVRLSASIVFTICILLFPWWVDVII